MSRSNFKLLALSLSVCAILAVCGCPPLVWFGWQFLPGQSKEAKEVEIAKVKADALVQFEKDVANAPFGVDGRNTFLPNSKITAPRLGSLRGHPWWSQPMTDAKVEAIVSAIAQLPLKHRHVLFLRQDGSTFTFEDDHTSPDTFARLNDNDSLVFFAAYTVQNKRYGLSRTSVISMLSQGLDAGAHSVEQVKKTGKGNSDWDVILRMNDGIDKIEGNPPMVPANPDTAIGPSKKKK